MKQSSKSFLEYSVFMLVPLGLTFMYHTLSLPPSLDDVYVKALLFEDEKRCLRDLYVAIPWSLSLPLFLSDKHLGTSRRSPLNRIAPYLCLVWVFSPSAWLCFNPDGFNPYADISCSIALGLLVLGLIVRLRK